MIERHGMWWPNDVGETWHHALEHVQSLEWTIPRCKQARTAVQAGGNIGLWPKRLAESFQRVITFEPDAISRECLFKNVPGWVEVHSEALGSGYGRCDIKHRGLGSHRVVEGVSVPVHPLDSLGLTDLDLLQLDVEGYEWHVLTGAYETLKRCHPLIQVELRNFTEKYGATDAEVYSLLSQLGYEVLAKRPGRDVVFQ